MRRGHHRLTVSYHAGQHGAEDFYLRLGFQPTSRYNQGEAIAERLLSAVPSPWACIFGA
jgi:diamine N-acetyltransferase